MKKNRASFFNENTDYYNTQNPNMVGQNMNLMPANGPMMGAQSSFFVNPNQFPNMNMNLSEDINARIAKLERQVNRLEHRINNLEQNQTNYSTDDYDNSINNMYMV